MTTALSTEPIPQATLENWIKLAVLAKRRAAGRITDDASAHQFMTTAVVHWSQPAGAAGELSGATIAWTEDP